MKSFDLVVIGSGASGLLAAVTALKEGIKNVLIIEKEENLGGNLNLFIHDGFGEFYLGESVTGPEFSSILIDQFISLGGQCLVNTKVMDLNREKLITYINPEEGITDIQADAIVIATGCKEKYTGNIMIPVDKYTGIFTTASAHRMVNFQGYLPGSKVVVLSNGIWSVTLARRLLIEGAEVTVVTEKSALNEDEAEIIKDFEIPVIYNSTIVEIEGNERIECAIISKSIGEDESIECNALVLPIGYFPEVDLLRKINAVPRKVIEEVSGIFSCGTILSGISGIFTSGEDGYSAGKLAALYLK